MSTPKQVSLWDKQYDFLFDESRESLLEAGIGYGKSMVASMWLFHQVDENPMSKWIMAARDYRQLKTAVDEEFEYYLHDVFGLMRNKHYNKTNGSPIVYEFRHNGAKIYGFGAQNYDTAFRAGNYFGAWGDEVDFWKPDAVKALRGRVRIGVQKIRWTSSPKGFNHVYDDFYRNKAGTVYNAPSHENLSLSQEYLDQLKKTYSPKLYEQEVLAKRLNLTVGAVYDEFDRDKHVKPCRHLLTPKDQLYFFTDYNISNYCGTYMFLKTDQAIPHLYMIGEEHLKFEGSEAMAMRLAQEPFNQPSIVCGDSTGNNKRDVAITDTNYQIFKRYGLMTKHIPNPPVQTRVITFNSMLHHGRVTIDPSCTNLIRDLELVSWREDGKDIDKGDITLTHSSDGAGYGVSHLLPLRKKPTIYGASQRR